MSFMLVILQWNSLRPITLAPRTLRAAAEAGHPDIEMVAPGEGDGAEQGSRAAAASKMGLASSLPPNLSHAYLVAPRRHAYDALRRSLRASGAERAAVFLNHPRRIPDAAQRLQAASMDAVSLHGGMDKIERGNALQRFRRGDANVIVLNEVGARGLDVPEVRASARETAHVLLLCAFTRVVLTGAAWLSPFASYSAVPSSTSSCPQTRGTTCIAQVARVAWVARGWCCPS